MAKVTVYRWKKYDISTDEKRVSRRWGTREAIERMGGEIIADTATEVDESVIQSDIEGLTVRNFNPNPRTDFQRQVT